MKKTLLWLILAGSASAQIMPPGFPPGVFLNRGPLDYSAAPSYTGPGDTISGASVFHSCAIAYNAAYAAGLNKACNMRRQSDNTTQDINFLATGYINAASAASFAGTDATCTGTIASTTATLTGCSSTPNANDPVSGAGIVQTPVPAYVVSCGTFVAGAGTCTLNASQTISVAETLTFQVALFVTEMYDQTGNALPVTQSTAADQPQFFPSVASVGGVPCPVVNGSQSLSGTSPADPQGYTLVAVGERTGNTSSYSPIMDATSNNVQFGFNNTAGQAYFYVGGSVLSATAAESAFHVLVGVANGASSALIADGGAPSTGNAGAESIFGTLMIGNGLTGQACADGVWPVAFTSTQYGNMHSNQSSYWGTP